MNSSNNWRTLQSDYIIKNYFHDLNRFGITRVANLTGLDFIDIPVYSVVRPCSLTLSVSSGKGITHSDAIVSGVMESIEAHIAETISPSEYFNTSFEQIPYDQRLQFHKLPVYPGSPFNESIFCSWLTLKSLKNERCVLYPAASITLNPKSTTESLPFFRTGTNGLASGFSLRDAYLSGLYEVIERDALTLWRYFHLSKGVPLSLINLSSLPYSSSLALIEKINSSGLKVLIQNISSPLGLPVIKALLGGNIDESLCVYEGFGCHHNPEIALNRAITEAVQARAVILSGCREDISTNTYNKTRFEYNSFKKLSETAYIDDFSHVVPQTTFQSLNHSIDNIHELLDASGFEPFFYDFETPQDYPFKVLKVVVPGFEDLQSSFDQASERMDKFIPDGLGFRSLFIKKG